MTNDKMNQVLRDRKKKNKQVAAYRRKRIYNNYHKLEKTLQVQQQNQDVNQDEGTRRRLEFYQQVFSQDKPQSQPKEKHAAPPVPIDNEEQKLEKLKNKQKKFIKKMKTQKTKKGQPIMRNYVKYALAKLEAIIAKEKQQTPKH